MNNDEKRWERLQGHVCDGQMSIFDILVEPKQKHMISECFNCYHEYEGRCACFKSEHFTKKVPDKFCSWYDGVG